MKMNKKKILISLSLICILLLIGGTFAYFSTTGTANNAISSSNVKIEMNLTDGEGEDVTPAVTVLPGQSEDRVVTVTNIGSEPAWVRIKAGIDVDGDVSIFDSDGKIADPPVSVENLNTTDWTYQGGFFYYGKALEPGEFTEALFNSVTFGTAMESDYAEKELVLKLDASATQCANNGTSALDASGWPE